VSGYSSMTMKDLELLMRRMMLAMPLTAKYKLHIPSSLVTLSGPKDR
jgi:hypothetical protein